MGHHGGKQSYQNPTKTADYTHKHNFPANIKKKRGGINLPINRQNDKIRVIKKYLHENPR